MRTVITIGSDRSLFTQGSKVLARQRAHGKLFHELHIIVFSLRSHQLATMRVADNVWIYPTNSRSRWWYVRDAVRVGKRIAAERNFEPSSVCISAQDPFEAGLSAYRLSRTLHAKLHLQVHTDLFSSYFTTGSLLNFIRVCIARFLLPKADGVRVVSRRIAESLRTQGVRLVRPPVVLPIYTEIPETSEPMERDAHTVLVMSRFSPEKDIATAIDAFALCAKDTAGATLLLVGDGIEKARLMRYAAQTLPPGTFQFMGWQNDTASFFRRAGAFLNPSRYEGYGLSLIEAAKAECPLVTTDVGIARELVPDVYAEFVCPVGDSVRIAKALRMLMVDQNLAYTYGKALRARAEAIAIQDMEHYVQDYRDSVEYCFL